MEFFISPTVMSVLHRHTGAHPQQYAEKVFPMDDSDRTVIVRRPGRDEFYPKKKRREESRRQK